jgi:energy-coupling factor transporter ATP-binding protein EcfA2
VPRWFLNKVDIVGGFLSGLSMELPRGLVCIIGPRGSGKSTLAEALRYAMSGTKGPTDERYSLIKANLGQSVITATAQREHESSLFTIRRVFGQSATLIGPDEKPVSGVDLDRGTFFPIDAYSADRIEKIAVETLGELRRDLLDELRADELHEIQLQVSKHRRLLEANADAIYSTEKAIGDVNERIEELGDARAQLNALPVPSDDESSNALVEASRQQQSNREESQNIEETCSATARFRVALKELIAEHAGQMRRPLSVPESQNSATLSPLYQHLARAAEIIIELGDRIDNEAADTQKYLESTKENLRVLHTTQDADFARLQEKNQAVGAAVRDRARAQQSVARLETLERQRTLAHEKLRELREQRKEMRVDYLLERENISAIRETVAAVLQREAGNKVRVRISRNADSLEYQQTLLAGLKGARVKNHDEILRALMRLRPEQFAQILLEDDLGEFIDLTSLGAERGRRILDSCRENLNALTLEVIAIEDKISIELNVGTVEEPNFKDASELSSGQKCTALLPILMARRDTPLIIDQPEDNLDNHFIYETVVETIKRLKERRQMIFVTHNANIPVLAEADLIIVLESDGRSGRIAKSGALNDCKDEIIDLLEGGREAFELRRKKYAAE